MNSRKNNRKGFRFHKNKRPHHFNNDGSKNKFKDNTPREFRHTLQLSEEEVGITEYVSDLEGFTGVIKARYSDFHVNEIDRNGELAILTNLDIPKIQKVEVNLDNLPDQSPLELLPQEIWTKVCKMIKSESEESVKFKVTELSKGERKIIHQKIKEVFGNKIAADTIMENEEKILEFKKSSGSNSNRTSWPEELGNYVHFLVYKEALDTMNACYQIAEAIRMKPSNFSYAGNKDKRGKTTQWFCVKQVEPWKLIVKTKKIRNIKIGNVTFKDKALKLGDLNGNRFKIVLRNIVCEDTIIQKAVESVKTNGFINYYGLQRFGNDKEVPTYSVGLELLLGKWKEACELILKQKTSDEPDLDITKAKKIYADTKDAEKAYECLQRNRNNCVEAKLLEGLSKNHKNEYVNALESIPRNMRLLYIHSFQSLIWNTMVSKRVKKFGLKPVENDLIVVNNVYFEPEIETVCEEDNDKNLDEKNDNLDIETGSIIEQKQQVKALTQSDLSNYTIFDIVMPLPGYDVQYPENMKDEYREELEKYGLTLEMPKQKVKTYTLSGSYRKICSQVQDIEWNIMKYNDPMKSLVLSDFDKLRKFEEPQNISDGRFKAVILEFSLDSSSYATMVLRELMKTDTSPSAQVKLNNYANTNTPKKIELTNNSSKESFETIDNNKSSLLNDQQRLEEFKKSVFADFSTKRKNEDSEEDSAAKKLKGEND
ncbi:hypothetical protein WA026_003566 [Henosepilachna vigintioctopunctata]|uniref:Pseudouridylate synthase 7 homolog n=1 Tax=Henosepilachna vigintioctopunctata TaxID=420089 RepID=A0AAW1TQ10_9CUCU